jgi:hypothetical protein
MRRQRPESGLIVGQSWWRGEILYTGLGIGLMLTLHPTAAFAYFDPNAGSMLFQLLSPVIFIAATVMLAVRGGIRSAIAAVRSVFTRARPGSADAQPEK